MGGCKISLVSLDYVNIHFVLITKMKHALLMTLASSPGFPGSLPQALLTLPPPSFAKLDSGKAWEGGPTFTPLLKQYTALLEQY